MDFILQKDIFKNPHKLPLNELNLEIKHVKKIKKVGKDQDLDKAKDDLMKNYEVRMEKVKALDSHWVQYQRTYKLYQPYYIEVSPAENEAFISSNKKFLECLDFLLQSTFQQFWCYVIYEPKIVLMLKSFIYHGVPWYETDQLEQKFLVLYLEVQEKISQICSRLLTYKESELEYMSEKSIWKYLEERKIFTFPVLFNLCLLYKNSNLNLINDLMNVYFVNTKDYNADLRKMLNQVLLVFEMLGGQVYGFEDDTVLVPIGVDRKPGHFDASWYEEVAKFLLDTAANLNAFLAVCKPAVELASEMGIPYRLSYFYNRVYPTIYKILNMKRNLPYDLTDLKVRTFDYLARGRSEFVQCFHIFVSACVDNVLQYQGDNVKQDQYLDQYIKLISTTLEDDYFIFDYHNSNNIDLQLQLITDFYPELDTMRTNYILECLHTLPNLQELLSLKKILSSTENKPLSSPASAVQQVSAIEKPKQKMKNLSESEIDERVRNVLDTLPHIGDGFIFRCLELYNYDPIEVITAILDENLPPSLQDLPKDLIRVPPEPEPQQPIYAFRGKKPTYKDAKELLNDKSDLKEIKDFVLKSTNLSYNMYDDEYDDRDDGEQPKIHLRDNTQDKNSYQHTQNRFEGYELVSDPSESSSDDEATRRNPNNFCEDPALVRERRDALWKQRGKSRDVVGKDKGQGQDKSVLNNRDKKNTQKSSRANHNRKGGAQFKRNKGMIPF